MSPEPAHRPSLTSEIFVPNTQELNDTLEFLHAHHFIMIANIESRRYALTTLSAHSWNAGLAVGVSGYPPAKSFVANASHIPHHTGEAARRSSRIIVRQHQTTGLFGNLRECGVSPKLYLARESRWLNLYFCAKPLPTTWR